MIGWHSTSTKSSDFHDFSTSEHPMSTVAKMCFNRQLCSNTTTFNVFHESTVNGRCRGHIPWKIHPQNDELSERN